jgi:hypothetical protein
MTGCGGGCGEGRVGRQRLHARDTEDGIQQSAIFGAQANVFVAQSRKLGFKGACAASRE